MSEAMRERIARRLAKEDGKDPDAPAWVRFPGGHPEGICWRDQYASKADAVLDELREPTEAMAEAGNTITDGVLYSATSIWRAMIDATQGTVTEGGDALELGTKAE